MSKEQRVEAPALVQLLNAALLYPESAEGYIRQVIEALSQPPTADAEILAKQWIATLQDESRVTDEDAEDLTLRLTAALSAAKQQGRDEQREKDARIAGTHERTHGDIHFGQCGPAIATSIKKR